ncbi:PP2C family protein-serine/threonine phosphatase [uncultured Jatrophihabitans sp.]|uniref:PP2C family protein-serine/threonine phosphatase n=1 Tax=uncultured Jatrophihabitans sp. TaxID=1610747 RepID=UPI0035CB46B0
MSLALSTRFPVTLLWGPDYTMVYNDAYPQMIGDKHSAALGRPAREVFPEIWDIIGPMLDEFRLTGEATWVEDARLLLQRQGFAEETFFTFSYSAVQNAAGEVEGVIDIASETTEQVIDRRRMRLLSELESALVELQTAQAVCDTAAVLLAAHDADVPGVEIRHPDLAPSAAGKPVPDNSGGGHPHGEAPNVWLTLPIANRGEAASFGVVLSPQLQPNGTYVDFIGLICASLSQAFNRIAAHDAEQRMAATERALSTALQRNLLTAPASIEGVAVAVRYQPAMQLAQIGGDWYDSFVLPGGSLTLAVGDVAGHDRNAAATMAQLRNVLRGVAYTRQDSPANIVAGLDSAMQALEPGSYATAILAQLVTHENGSMGLRWSNAGHLPPVLLDGRGARLLSSPPNVMLGVCDQPRRTDNLLTLTTDATIVLYTDGLIERRDVDIDDSLNCLLGALSGRHRLSSEALCDELLGRFGESSTDDIALLVLRVTPSR